MPQFVAIRREAVVRAPGFAAAPPTPRYAHDAPERTLLYALVQAHYPDFLERLAHEDRTVPSKCARSSTSICAAAYSITASCEAHDHEPTR